MTGLYSREAFFEKAQEMILEHEPGYYIMACFDIEKFKVINDQYGTKKGDEVLQIIANIFRKGFEKEGGICCRFMADYYAVLYPKAFKDTKQIKKIWEKATVLDGSILPITFSIGRYIVDDTNLTPSAMYDRAVMAKELVKGRYDEHVAEYDESMRNRILREQEVISEMNTALKGNQFEVWYQPQYNHATHALTGAEALVRWRHPQKGLISPGVFIPIFEKNGFVYEVDKYVWEQVCVFLSSYLKTGQKLVPVSVNISRYDIFRDDLIDVITGLVKKYKIPVDLLRLEITESAFAKSGNQVIDIVKKLQDFGFTMEIDDFGSGYSSLNTLKDVPADVLKLDMRFLEGEDNSTRGGNIVESIVRMTKWLGMSVIAEGVETIEQADYLNSIGCNYIQGYLYAKPMPENEYRTVIANSEKEVTLLELETVESLDNDIFWDPKSIETLIFNSYVGGASVFEYYNDEIEVLRINKKYAQMLGGDTMTMDEAIEIVWTDFADEEGLQKTKLAMKNAIETGQEVTAELKLTNLRGTKEVTYLKLVMRVIAHTDDRYLFYCMLEDLTSQRLAEHKEEEISRQLQIILNNIGSGVTAIRLKKGKVDFVFANERYYEMLGFTRRQYLDEVEDTFHLVHPEDRKLVREKIEKACLTEQPTILKYRSYTREGYEIWVKNVVSIARLNPYEEPIQISILTDITKDVLNAERLQLNENQLNYMNKTLSDLMDDTPGGFARIKIKENGEAAAVYINKGFADLLGMTEVYIMRFFSKNAYWALHPDDVPILKETIKKMYSAHGTHFTKYRLIHKGGGYWLFQVYGRTSRDEKGEVYINAYFTDISEQNQLEKQRRELIENLPCGAGIYEYNGKKISVVYLNTRYRELVGREIELKGKNVSALISVRKDERENLLRILTDAIEQNTRCESDVHILHGNGKYLPFHLTGNIVKQNDGKTMIYTTYTPITETEMSYREMLPVSLATMMASSTDLSFVKDKNFSYICCSHALAKLVELKDEKDVVGKTDYDLFSKEFADKYRSDDIKLLKEGQSLIDFEETILSNDGTLHYSRTSKYILKDSDGNIIGMYGVGRDISEHKDAYARLKLLTDTLPGGIAMFEVSSEQVQLLYASDGIYNLVGYSREEYDEIMNHDYMELIFEEDRHILSKQIEDVIKYNAPVDCTLRILPKDREHRWINIKGTPTDNRNGKISVRSFIET